jgi:pimeloyl-ACP methyl ester carboxylesterase
MLHEGLGSIALWKDFPQRLASRTGCGVLVYSRYGHGNSDKLMEKRPVEFMHHEGEVVLPALLDKLGIRQPILLGHSDGASISIIFAGKYPDAVRGLILEAPHVFVEDLTVASIEQAKVAYETTDLPKRLDRYHANVGATFWGWNDIWLDPIFVHGILKSTCLRFDARSSAFRGKTMNMGRRHRCRRSGRSCREPGLWCWQPVSTRRIVIKRIRRWSVWQSSSRRWRAGCRAGSR